MIFNYFNNNNFNGFHNVPKYFQFHQFQLSCEESNTFDDKIARFYEKTKPKKELDSYEEQIAKIKWNDKLKPQNSDDLGDNFKLSNIHLTTFYHGKIDFEDRNIKDFPVSRVSDINVVVDFQFF